MDIQRVIILFLTHSYANTPPTHSFPNLVFWKRVCCSPHLPEALKISRQGCISKKALPLSAKARIVYTLGKLCMFALRPYSELPGGLSSEPMS